MQLHALDELLCIDSYFLNELLCIDSYFSQGIVPAAGGVVANALAVDGGGTGTQV
jgi:hypothetical protein